MKFEAGKPVRLIALVWRRWQASRQEEWKGRVDIGIQESELPGARVGKHCLLIVAGIVQQKCHSKGW